MIEFAWPLAFAALPLPLLVRWLSRPASSQESALLVPDANAFAVSDVRASAAKRSHWREVWLWLGWATLIVALARPQITGDPVLLPATGRDLMLAVDISGSMSTEDLALGRGRADRLTVVKTVVREFVQRRRGDRVGLVLFGSRAYLQSPLTFDLNTVETLLMEAPVGIAGGKTAIGDAIGLAVKRLRHRPSEGRVLVLLTDGANNAGAVSPRRAAQLAAVTGIRIHTIGVGREPAVRQAAGGTRVTSPGSGLDEATLADVAGITGGDFFRASDTEGLRDVYRRIDALEPVAQDAKPYRPVSELYHYPLAAAALLLLAAAISRIPLVGATFVVARNDRTKAVRPPNAGGDKPHPYEAPANAD